MERLQKLILLIQNFISRKGWGKITISFESGTITTVNVAENIKL